MHIIEDCNKNNETSVNDLMRMGGNDKCQEYVQKNVIHMLNRCVQEEYKGKST